MAQSQQQDALMSIDGNSQSVAARQQENSFDPLSEENSKPVPAFSHESQQHQFLHNKLMRQEKSGQQQGQYVSPSDNILSPASQKLNAFKERRFTKQAKPRALFASTKPLSFEGLREDAGCAGNAQSQFTDIAKEEETKMSEG